MWPDRLTLISHAHYRKIVLVVSPSKNGQRTVHARYQTIYGVTFSRTSQNHQLLGSARRRLVVVDRPRHSTGPSLLHDQTNPKDPPQNGEVRTIRHIRGGQSTVNNQLPLFKCHSSLYMQCITCKLALENHQINEH